MTCHISLVSHPQLYQNLTARIIVLISRASLTFFDIHKKLLDCIYQYIVLSWMFVWKCRCHQVARAKKVLGLALFYPGNNDDHMAM